MRKVIVKVGTNVLTDEHGMLNGSVIDRLASEISRLQAESDNKFVIVTSGAVAAGRAAAQSLNMPTGKSAKKQLCASIGQPILMAHYIQAFRNHNVICSQVLLTKRNFNDKRRILMLRRIIGQDGVIPILNENDAITATGVRNMTFRDNDKLAAETSNLIGADILIILSDVPGVLVQVCDHSTLVPVIHDVDEYLQFIDSSAGTGSGGMGSKLETARSVTSSDTEMFIADGTRPGVISDILAGKQVGTRFPAKT